MVKSEIGLSQNESLNKIKRQRTQDVCQNNQLMVTKELKAGGSRYDAMSNLGEQIEDFKKSVSKCEDKLIQYTLHSPIVQKHERTPSFLNKLPVNLKNLINNNEGGVSENFAGSNRR